MKNICKIVSKAKYKFLAFFKETCKLIFTHITTPVYVRHGAFRMAIFKNKYLNDQANKVFIIVNNRNFINNFTLDTISK